MKNQTAIEYLIAESSKILGPLNYKFSEEQNLIEIIANAKEMEIEQIAKAFQDGVDKGFYIGGGSK